MTALYHYRIYGRHLACNRRLPCVESASCAKPDFVVSYRSDPSRPLADAPAAAVCDPITRELVWEDRDRSFHLRYTDPLNGSRLEFTISADGASVAVDWDEAVLVDDIHRVLLGPVFGWLLAQAGTVALHANTVAVDEGACVICGHSGAGKSSTTAAMVAAGHPLLADDIAALDPQAGAMAVHHGYPHLRLWPDTAQALGPDWKNLPLVFQRTANVGEKYYRDLADMPGLFRASALPLRAIYLLGPRIADRSAIRVDRLANAQAIPLLLKNLYLGLSAQRHARMAQSLPCIAELVERCPVFTVQMPDGLDRLIMSAEALAEHAASLHA
ncbi:HPr kinase/phosphorylase [Pigmentiphaga humi]|uniref:HPr kinase/phosphorylase n=1 Tax=Pigmentiphaga humi TaxID=2478468 RepID=A0A3P4B4M0_9BURK|nr:hypothetical protein [Pigmentiphaga humi]VCU71233.1 HPr kinase/phosphorylase [Pigmentiphaga humi]